MTLPWAPLAVGRAVPVPPPGRDGRAGRAALAVDWLRSLSAPVRTWQAPQVLVVAEEPVAGTPARGAAEGPSPRAFHLLPGAALRESRGWGCRSPGPTQGPPGPHGLPGILRAPTHPGTAPAGPGRGPGHHAHWLCVFESCWAPWHLVGQRGGEACALRRHFVAGDRSRERGRWGFDAIGAPCAQAADGLHMEWL